MAYNERLAMKQGWLLVDRCERPSGGGPYEIQRWDEANKFPDDTAARTYVEGLAKRGSRHARYCLNRTGD